MNPSNSSTSTRPDQRRAHAGERAARPLDGTASGAPARTSARGARLTKSAGILALLTVAAAPLWAAGCAEGVGLTCDYNAGSFDHYCFAYSADSSPTSCSDTSDKGTEVDACPTADRIGACTNSYGGIVGDPEPGTSIYYSDGGLTAAAAKASCLEGDGTWSP